MGWQDELSTLPDSRRGPDAPMSLRHRLTAQDVWRMIDSGVITEDDRVELWEGQLIDMSPKHFRHEWIKNALMTYLVVRLQRRFDVAVESTVYLTRSTFIEPDVVVKPRHMRSTDVRGPDLLLSVEVADSSHRVDTGSKPALYAAHDAPLLWVIDARDGYTPSVRRYSKPTDSGYAVVEDLAMDDMLTLPFATDVSFKLREVLYGETSELEP